MSDATILIGRTLDAQGKPLEGTGVMLDRNSPTAKLLLAQETIIMSNPATKEYGAGVQVRDEQGNMVYKGLGIIPPQAIGPPEHIHPTYDEIFMVVEGRFEFFLDGKAWTIGEGEKVMVRRGTAHTFKPASKDRVCSFLVEATPPGKLHEVIRTIWGLAHDGKTDSKGQPSEFWQGIAIGDELKEDTLFVSPPPFIQHFMFMLFGNTAREKGYRGIYDKYSSDSFWTSRVEQLPKNA